MKTVLRIGALVAALTFAAPAAAQQQSQGRVGIGLGMPVSDVGQLFNITAASAPQIFVPINVAPNLRIEPQLGYFKISDDADNTDDSSFTLGAGVFYVKPVVQQAQLYLGGRLAATWNRDEDRTSATNVDKAEWTNLTIAGVFGGEYLPSPWFSVGAEAQLAYTSIGDTDHTNSLGVTTTEQGGSIFSTQGLLFLRVYFL